MNWREMERARVAAGKGVYFVTWSCTHSRGVYMDQAHKSAGVRARSHPWKWLSFQKRRAVR